MYSAPKRRDDFGVPAQKSAVGMGIVAVIIEGLSSVLVRLRCKLLFSQEDREPETSLIQLSRGRWLLGHVLG